LSGVGAAGCGSKSSGTSRALPFGTYAVSAPVCVSTGKAPAYPAANYRAALYDFSGLSSRTWTVELRALTETFVDADCTLTIARGIFDNSDSSFSWRKNRRHSFTPEGCELAVDFAGREWPVSPSYTDLFTDGDALDEDLPFEVTEVATEAGTSYELLSATRPDLDSLWKAYGCAAEDQLRWTLAAP
jgi:hypothetical protein